MDLSSEALRIAFVPIFIFLHTYNEILRIPCLTSIRNWAKSGSGGPGPESAPRGTKSTTFAKGFFQPFNLRFFHNPAKGSFGFAHSMSDIPMTPRCSLRSFRNWRLVCSELHIKTDFEIYGSSIGVCNYVIGSNPINQINSNQIESINPSIKSNRIKSNQINQSINNSNQINWNEINRMKLNQINQSINQTKPNQTKPNKSNQSINQSIKQRKLNQIKATNNWTNQSINQSMIQWMNGWMNEWLKEGKKEERNEWMNESIN